MSKFMADMTTIEPVVTTTEPVQPTDCYASDKMNLKAFAIILRPYMIPATIEFSITCGTIFFITWSKIGSKNLKSFSLPPVKEHFKEVGKINMPFLNSYIMLDCTKTSRGLFFGILIFTCKQLKVIIFIWPFNFKKHILNRYPLKLHSICHLQSRSQYS